jgi:hypothetical protein
MAAVRYAAATRLHRLNFRDRPEAVIGRSENRTLNAPVQRQRASAVRCNRLLAGQTYCNRSIGGTIHLPSSASGFGT